MCILLKYRLLVENVYLCCLVFVLYRTQNHIVVISNSRTLVFNWNKYTTFIFESVLKSSRVIV